MFENLDIFYDNTNNCYQVRTKANTYSIEFDSDEKYQIFQALLLEAKNKSISLLELFEKLSEKYEEAKVIDVLSNLNDFDMLPQHDLFEMEGKLRKSNNDVASNYWIEGEKLENIALLLIGESKLSEKIIEKCSHINFKEFKNISTSEIIESNDAYLNTLFNQYDFLIMDGVEWNPFVIEKINKKALEFKKPWLFVGGLEEYFFKIGPIFYGKETGCYDCLIKRVKSNHDYINYFNSYESYLKEAKLSSKPDTFPRIELYYDIVASISVLEIVKFYELWAVPVVWKHYISINALNFEVTKHGLLKVPFCETCKPELEYNPSPWLETISLK